MTASSWQLETGAHVIDGGRVRFRVWAPAARKVEVEVYPWPHGIVRHDMARDGDGVWSAVIEASAGTLYRYRLDEHWAYADPCSRSQPEGVHGPSQVIDPASFRWTDGGWHGLDTQTLVLYELHVGTYTPEGTFDALVGQLDELKSLGVTALELMPIAEFPGQRNWGYDGVDLFAPESTYGGPAGLQRLVNEAHARGIGIILDVVYNHLGPDGNYLRSFSPDYFTDRHQTPWGDAINFDGDNSRPVRRFFVWNALYWLHEYHIDGLRLDASHQMHDDGSKHILQELAEAVHKLGPAGRSSLIMAEDERNNPRLVLPPDGGGYGLDATWVDDFHHTVHVLLTGEYEGYLGSYEGTAVEIARLLRVGFLYHTPPKDPGEEPAGVAPMIPAHQLIYCLQNHDQVGNRPFGKRLCNLVDVERYKAACALLLLVPCTPLVFMGDEFAASTPFLYFTDHHQELAEQVAAGRIEEFRSFWASREREWQRIPDPQSEETFERSRLDLRDRERSPNSGVYSLWKELLRLRHRDTVFMKQDRWRMLAEAAAPALVAVERWDEDENRRLLLVNLGETDANFDLAEQPWLGDAAGVAWEPLLCSAEQRFAGPGVDLQALELLPGAPVTVPRGSAIVWAADLTP